MFLFCFSYCIEFECRDMAANYKMMLATHTDTYIFILIIVQKHTFYVHL